MLAHLVGTGGAVDADDVDAAAGRWRPARRRSRCPASMRPVTSMVTWAWIGHLAPAAGHGPAGADHRGLEAEEVELGLDEQHVDAALEQAGRLHLVGVAQVGEADLAERGELRAGADRAGDAVPAVDRSATSRAMRAAARLISWARSAMSYSPSGTAKAPKVSVSTTSAPTSK